MSTLLIKDVELKILQVFCNTAVMQYPAIGMHSTCQSISTHPFEGNISQLLLLILSSVITALVSLSFVLEALIVPVLLLIAAGL